MSSRGTPAAVAIACLLGLGAGARAQPPELIEDNPLKSLVPSADEEQRAREAELERGLEALFRELDGVKEARVKLDLAAPYSALDAPRQASVAVVLGVRAPLAEERVVSLARGAALELRDARVSVEVTAERPEVTVAASPKLTRVGPFEVRADSAGALRWLLAATLSANVLLATLLLARLRRSSHEM